MKIIFSILQPFSNSQIFLQKCFDKQSWVGKQVALFL